jgi:signal transduction histidine kinase
VAGGSDSEAGARDTAGRPQPDLLSIVTHDIGNQLTVIGGFAEMLADGVDDLPPDMVREFSQAILRGAEQMRALLQSISDLRRLDAGKLDVQPESVDLVPLVRRVVDQWRPQLGSRPVDLLLPEELVIRADPYRVQQILGNLLSNVSKFTPPTGRVAVELTRAGPATELSVTDSGPGIPPDRAAAAFERFTQLRTGIKGTGIGLYVSRQVARAHGGDLVLDNHAPGARFVLRLPQQEA